MSHVPLVPGITTRIECLGMKAPGHGDHGDLERRWFNIFVSTHPFPSAARSRGLDRQGRCWATTPLGVLPAAADAVAGKAKRPSAAEARPPRLRFAHGARFRARVRAIRRSSANLEPEDLHQAATSLPAWLELKVRAELVRFGLLARPALASPRHRVVRNRRAGWG